MQTLLAALLLLATIWPAAAVADQKDNLVNQCIYAPNPAMSIYLCNSALNTGLNFNGEQLAVLYIGIARGAENLVDLPTAINYYGRAISAFDAGWFAYWQRGKLLDQSGDLQGALSDLQAALERYTFSENVSENDIRAMVEDVQLRLNPPAGPKVCEIKAILTDIDAGRTQLSFVARQNKTAGHGIINCSDYLYAGEISNSDARFSRIMRGAGLGETPEQIASVQRLRELMIENGYREVGKGEQWYSYQFSE